MNFDYNISEMKVSEFKSMLTDYYETMSEQDFYRIKQLAKDDGRSGILAAVESAYKKHNKLQSEIERTEILYQYQIDIAVKESQKESDTSNQLSVDEECDYQNVDNGSVTILGLDEVGRGPLAGPLTVGGVILREEPKILNLNDSKQLKPIKRKALSDEIFKQAIFADVFSVPPRYIDKLGMTECLRRAFKTIISNAEKYGNKIDIVLLDGNPLYIDPREINVVKGDVKCASIAAASIVAKVARDSYMEKISDDYSDYCFARNKGYGTAEHIEAIKKNGLSPIHRRSFCTSFLQMSMF